MIHVTKKELTERTFVPYQITITVSNKEEHDKLRKEFMNLQNSDRWYQTLFRDGVAVRALAREVLNHIV